MRWRRPVAKMASARSMYCVDESGKGSVEMEKVLHVSGVGAVLADDGESAGKSCSNAHQVLQ